tara:strand:+ start:606 stop:1778 length:1173 start_codon:yes stop_codon:yes gene_type:complete
LKYYLDACATTPMLDSVISVINDINRDIYGNPSSLHIEGINAANILEKSRYKIANFFGTSFEKVIFTSGATESVNIAIKGVCNLLKPGRLVISSLEHSCVKNAALSLKNKGWDIEYWPVDKHGNILIDYAEKLLSKPTKMVSITWAQNEIGTVQPINIIGKMCKEKEIFFHTDATQLIPHSSIDFDNSFIDLLSASSHKLQGPKGVGLLLSKLEINKSICSINSGGNQELGLRPGTEPISLIAGMCKALEEIKDTIVYDGVNTKFKDSKIFDNTKKLYNLLSKYNNISLVGNTFDHNRIPNNISIIVKDKSGNPLNSRSIVRRLSDKGVFVSSGSACSSNSESENNSLVSIGIDKIFLNSLLRISLGSWIESDKIELISSRFNEVLSDYP